MTFLSGLFVLPSIRKYALELPEHAIIQIGLILPPRLLLLQTRDEVVYPRHDASSHCIAYTYRNPTSAGPLFLFLNKREYGLGTPTEIKLGFTTTQEKPRRSLMESLVELFCHVDDFCKAFLPTMDGKRQLSVEYKPPKTRSVLDDERNHDDFDCFSSVTLPELQGVLSRTCFGTSECAASFPGLVSYTRFVDYIPSALMPLMCIYSKPLFALAIAQGSHLSIRTSLDVCLQPTNFFTQSLCRVG